jgi:UDP-N-acetylglucosamine acyltransferase
MANSAALGGHVLVEDGAILGGILGVHQFTRIGTLCMVGGMTRVSQDCPPYMMVAGNPAEVHGLNSVGLKRNGVSEQAQRLLKNAYRVLYRENLTVRQAIESLRAADETCPEVEHLLSFFETSERGVAR